MPPSKFKYASLLFVVTLAAGVFFATTTPAQQGTHCKMPDHLAVVASNDNQALDAGVATAALLPNMQCVNDPSYVGWGELLNVRAGHPDRGLHLFPASVAWLPDRLRAEAATTNGTVTILHTTGGQLNEWASFTPTAAVLLADQIDATAP